MQFIKYSAIIACFLSYFYACADNKAVVIVPVADILGSPIKSFGLASSIKDSYETIGICGAPNNSSVGSPRIHQLLFNEVVDIVTDEQTLEQSDEVCIRFEGAFFITSQDSNQNHLYWTQKKNLLTFKKMKQRKLNLSQIPPPLSFKNPNTQLEQPVIVLIKPWFDPITQQTFSAGTRFAYHSNENNENHFKVPVFDRLTTSYKTTFIPFSHAQTVMVKSKQESISCFVNTLKQWAHEVQGKIPYVWGGCSFITTDSPFDFQLTPRKIKKNKKCMVYERAEYNHCPLPGFDCTGLILRAAQVCSIPYYYKNTYTLAQFLEQLTPQDKLQEGDIIWIPGHVMVVSDIENNRLIEARGYSHDYGIVQEIELGKVFKGINTYQQLTEAHDARSSLNRLNRAGQDVEHISKFKIFKLESTWK
jgi:cell wall-associated NlpC family hydrolase